MNVPSMKSFSGRFGLHYAQEQLEESIPPHLWGGLYRYFEHGVDPGGFLRSVLEGDLFMAAARADTGSAAALHDLAMWIIWYAPSGSYGSRHTVELWMKRQQAVDELVSEG
jgi:hypothetical protein